MGQIHSRTTARATAAVVAMAACLSMLLAGVPTPAAAQGTQTLTINVSALPDDGTQFQTIITGAGVFAIEDLQNGSSNVTMPLASASVSIVHQLPLGWAGSISCDSAEEPLVFVFPESLSVDVTLQPDEDVTCNIVNTRVDPVTLTVEKTAVGAAAGETFDFFLGDGTALSIPANGATTLLVNPGRLIVEEQLGAGWLFESAVCTVATIPRYDGRVDFDAEPGDTVTCTFVNVEDAYAGAPDPGAPVPSLNPVTEASASSRLNTTQLSAGLAALAASLGLAGWLRPGRRPTA